MTPLQILALVVACVAVFGCLMFWLGDTILSEAEQERVDLARSGSRCGLHGKWS